MKFKLGNCCCTSGCAGTGICYDNKITQLPNQIYVVVSGTPFDPSFTEAQLKTHGVIPNNLSGGAVTGWTIGTTINYDPNVLGWFFNKKYKLKNQAAWDYERLGKDHVTTGLPISDCFFYVDNPYSGGRLDCYYEYSQIFRIREELYTQGCTDVPSWDWKYYGKNVFDIPTGVIPEPSCPTSGISYMTAVHSDYNTCPKPAWGTIFCDDELVADGCGEGYFMCGVLQSTDNETNYLHNALDYFNGSQGPRIVTFYKEDRFIISSTNETVDVFLDDGTDYSINCTSCGLGLIYPRIDFSWPDKANTETYDGKLKFQAVGHELLDTETELGNDNDYPGLAILGINLDTPQALEGKTYDAFLTAPRMGLTIDFKVPLPITYPEIVEQWFMPWTGGSDLWKAKTTLQTSNALPWIAHNTTGIVSIAFAYYGSVINGNTGTVKDATYKVYTCGYSGIKLKLTCDPTDAYEVF